MSTILITYKDPRLLSDGEKLLAVVDEGAAENEESKRQKVLETVPLCTIENIRLRAETMSQLLKKILDCYPEPHWGINE